MLHHKSQIRGLHTPFIKFNQTCDLTLIWMPVTHDSLWARQKQWHLDTCSDNLPFAWQINKILFFSPTSTLNQSHQQPLRLRCEWRLPPEISRIPSRHHPAAETVTNWYLEDMLLKIISFTFKDYTVNNKTRTAICKTWGLQIAGGNTTSNFVPFEIA